MLKRKRIKIYRKLKQSKPKCLTSNLKKEMMKAVIIVVTLHRHDKVCIKLVCNMIVTLIMYQCLISGHVNIHPGSMRRVDFMWQTSFFFILKATINSWIITATIQMQAMSAESLQIQQVKVTTVLKSHSVHKSLKRASTLRNVFFFGFLEVPHSTCPLPPLLLALTPALLMCSQGSLAQFLNSCSMAMWRTCSSDANESFSCTATVSSSNTSVEEDRGRKQQSVIWFSHTRSTYMQTKKRERKSIILLTEGANNKDDRKLICLK